MKLLAEIERQIDRRVRGLFQSGSTEHAALIELERAIIEAVLARVEHLPRGRTVFPYNRVHITIASPAERRRPYELVFRDDSFAREINQSLRAEECETPADLRIDVSLDESAAAPFHVQCYQDQPARTEATASISLQLLKSGEILQFTQERIHIGRMPEVVDQRKRPIRRNDIVIDEPSVSRAHAHIEYERESGTLRIFDDGSAYGTSILHLGRLVEVARTGRGVALSAGDEILVGHARLAVNP